MQVWYQPFRVIVNKDFQECNLFPSLSKEPFFHVVKTFLLMRFRQVEVRFYPNCALGNRAFSPLGFDRSKSMLAQAFWEIGAIEGLAR